MEKKPHRDDMLRFAPLEPTPPTVARALSTKPATASAELLFNHRGCTHILRSIADGVIAADRDGAVMFMNSAAESMTGWTSAAAMGRPFDDVFVIVSEDSRQRMESPVDRVLREGRVLDLPDRPLLVRRDGAELAIADSAAPLRLDDGTLVGVVLVFRDVSTERRQAQREQFLARAAAALSSSLDYETTLRAVADEAVPEFADWCAVDLVDGGVVRRLALAHVDQAKVALALELEKSCLPDPNQASAETWLGRLGLAASAIGKTCAILEVDSAVVESQARNDAQLELLRRLSLRSFIEAPVCVGGQVACVITFAMTDSSRRHDDRDVATTTSLTDRVAVAIENAHSYREAQRLREEAERANQAKDQFLAMLGHELRNLLAPIASAVDLVRMRVGSGIPRELTVIDRQLRHVVRLVDDLLDVSRITHGRVDLQREKVDLFDVISGAVEWARPLINERHHELVVDAGPGLLVLGDRERLTQVVGNIFANAAKYTQANGRIEAVARRVGDGIVVRVRDNGMGIAPEMMSRVFDLFAQDPRALDRSQGGLGLGLAIVRALVAAHDGTVTAASDGPGKGSEFTIELPALPVNEREKRSREPCDGC